jgi:TrmH family RNA methyltransferase
MDITSSSNQKVKDLVRLRTKRRIRDETKTFLIEGYRELERAARAKVELLEIFYCEEWFLGKNEPKLIEKILSQNKGSKSYRVSADVFKKISYRDRPDGLICLAKQWETKLKPLARGEKDKKLVLIIESVEKPGNLGTILRGADATGVDAVVLCDIATDIFNPNVVRASTGALFSNNIMVAETTEVIDWAKANGLKIVSTTPHTEDLIWDAKLDVDLALVAGAEQYGLSETWFKLSDELVKLPMLGEADSLNIAVSTITCLYEVLRQRGA